nr:hypothetical protein BaRGS_008742 [Batillaria attramentaria]
MNCATYEKEKFFAASGAREPVASRIDEVRPPKAKSFDTMLCLDISESMTKGGAFEEMKRTALAFIDGVEDVINDSGVEENMGLVTFGGRANVIQNLTNDFSHIRDGIELSDDEKQQVLDVVEKELENPNRARNRRAKPTDIDYVFEDTDSLHWVQWDGGDYNCYAFSKRRGYHIWKTDDHPRLKAENEPLEIGMTVKKGPKWNPAEAEEGQGVGMGVVIRKSESKGKIVVRWSNGVRQTCNWSPHGSQEVEYW